MKKWSEGRLPRVLIVSINPLSSSSNNGKTFASFFRGYPKGALAQLYLHRETPSSNVCNNYFRISDEEVVLGTLRRAPWLGAEVANSVAPVRMVSATTSRVLASSKGVRWIRGKLLELALRRPNPVLDQWLANLNPEVIFFCGGDSIHLYSFVESIASRWGLPIVSYITDDYVLPVPWEAPVPRFVRYAVRRRFLRMARRSALVLTIGQKMSSTYEQAYGFSSEPIMNLIELPPEVPPPAGSEMRLVYAGGLHLNRWRVLESIGLSLERLRSRGISAELHIYTWTLMSAGARRSLERIPSIRLLAAVDPVTLQEVYQDAGVLVHVESFHRKSRVATRLSVSTKIPEYLATGTPILAVGPAEVASMEYLRDLRIASVATSSDAAAIDQAVLRTLQLSQSARDELQRSAREVLEKNHNAARARASLWDALRGAARNGPPTRPHPGTGGGDEQ